MNDDTKIKTPPKLTEILKEARKEYKEKYGRLMTEEEALNYADDFQREMIERRIFNED